MDYLAVSSLTTPPGSTIFKRIWAEQVLIDTADSHSVSLCQHNTHFFHFKTRGEEVSWKIKLHYGETAKWEIIVAHWPSSRWEGGGRRSPAPLRASLRPQRVQTAHVVAHCEIQAHLQLRPLFAQHEGDTSVLGTDCAALHYSMQTIFYSHVWFTAQKA